MQHSAAAPPGGIEIVGCHHAKSEPLVIMGGYPCGGIERALLQRCIDFATRELAGNDAELLHDTPGKAADAHPKAIELVRKLELFAEPAAHLATGIAARERVDIVFSVKLVHQVDPAAAIHPGVLHAAVWTERNPGG